MARCLHRGSHHGCDVHTDSSLRRLHGEAVAAEDERDAMLEACSQVGLEELPCLCGVEPADVDARDLDADGDHVGARRVEVVRVGAARRKRDAAHGEESSPG